MTTTDSGTGTGAGAGAGTGPRTVDASSAATLQARNSAAFWAATGRSRGHRVIREPGYLAVDGDARAGLRVLVQQPDLAAETVEEIARLAAGAAGPVDVEDPFSTTDFGPLGLGPGQMPVMFRNPGPLPAPPASGVEVARVTGEDGLRAAERAVVSGFGLVRFEPYRGGEMFPAALLDQPGVAVFLARIDGRPAGACVTVEADGVASHYWVGTPEEFRSRGVARAVMHASLAPLTGLPVTLTASRLGRPLYESLGYTAASQSTWWSVR